jgi:hypothetical protein
MRRGNPMSEKTQMQELTTCCFCGSESVEAIPDHDEDGPMFWVYCGRCEAQGPVIYSVPSEGHTATPAEAIAAWNTRATATPTEGEGVRTIARRITRELRKGCGDNSCYFRQSQRGGMGTNGGCRCHERVAEILTTSTPQPTDAARAEAHAAFGLAMLRYFYEDEFLFETVQSEDICPILAAHGFMEWRAYDPATDGEHSILYAGDEGWFWTATAIAAARKE